MPEGLQTDEPKTSSPLAEGQYPRWPRGPFQGEAEGRKPPPDRRSVTPTLGPSYRLLYVGSNGLCPLGPSYRLLYVGPNGLCPFGPIWTPSN